MYTLTLAHLGHTFHVHADAVLVVAVLAFALVRLARKAVR